MDSFKAVQEGFLNKIPIYFKMGALLFLILILLIPINMIDNMIGERRYRQAQVGGEISRIWGREQSLFGPVLILPYRQPIEIEIEDGGRSIKHVEGRAYLLPETLSLSASVAPEVRYRGIFEAIVYRGDLRFEGSFVAPDIAGLDLSDAVIQWERAVLAVGVSDLRGTRGALRLTFGDTESAFEPGTTSDVIGSGINAAVGEALSGGWPEGGRIPFTFDLDIAGSSGLFFTPSAKETTVTLTSPWKHPRFQGAWLPAERNISADGFKARWEVSWFGRGFPQQWTDKIYADGVLHERIEKSEFGVSLITPVDFYLKSERSVKYAILFVLLIFATVFIMEVAVPVRVHTIQYALVGFAMTVFYLLLLALAEVIGFANGFLVAALASTAMIAFYLGHSARSRVLGAQVTAVMIGIYGFLYVVLQLEDYALLVGAVGLVTALAAVMYATRNIDWYAMGGKRENEKEVAKG